MIKNKSVIALLVSLCICICFFSFTAFAGSDSSISIELDKTEAKVGEIIKATIKVNNIKDFSGYQVNLRYNPKVLEAIDPATKSGFDKTTNPSGNDILLNDKFFPVAMSNNIPSDGILNFGRSYLGAEEYRKSGKPETNGILAVIDFKVIKEAATELIFEDLGSMPNSVDGTLLFSWDSQQITSGYDVKISPKINPNAAPEPMPKYTMNNKVSASDKDNDNKKTLVIVIIAVVVLIAIAVLVFVARGGKGTVSADDEKEWLDEEDSDEAEESEGGYEDDGVKQDQETQETEENKE